MAKAGVVHLRKKRPDFQGAFSEKLLFGFTYATNKKAPEHQGLFCYSSLPLDVH
jgi:hypothetical protein